MPAILRLLALITLLLMPLAGAQAQGTAPAAAAPPAEAPAAEPAATAPQGDAAKALLDVLKDDKARADLIRLLESGAGQPAAGTLSVQKSAEPVNEVAVPLAKEIGSVTQDVSRQLVDVMLKIGRGLGNLGRLTDGSLQIDWQGMRDQVVTLAILVVFTFAVLTIIRFLARWPLRAIATAAAPAAPLTRGAWVGLAFLIDTTAIGLTFLAASAYALSTSDGARIELLESLFLDAFVVIELIKVALAALLQGQRPSLRLLPISDETARFWYFWLSRLIGFLGYGVLVAHPIVNKAIGFSVGIGFRLAVVLITLIAAVTLVMVKRNDVRAGLSGAIERLQGGFLRALLALLAHAWHVLVIAYLVVAFVLWVSRPFDAVDFMARATAETLVAILLGGLFLSALSQGIADGVRLPGDVKRALPLLESRLNLLIPMLLRIIRILVALTVVAVLLQSWAVIDLRAAFESDTGTDLIGRVVSALIIVTVAMAIWLATSSWVEYRLNPSLGRASNARTRTLLSLFRNAFSILLIVIATMLALSQLGIDIAPLIAGAGVVGLAVGFGSQKLVQDIITGAFIQLENAMNEGDVVTVAGVSGVVERLTIRSVGIRDGDGIYHIIPFSSVDSVSNFMRGFSFHVATLEVGYREDIGRAKAAMQTAYQRLMETDRGGYVLEPLEMQGVVAFGQNGVTLKARIKTLPGEQWATGRLYSELLKQVLDEEGIEIPYPQTRIWFTGPTPAGVGDAALAAEAHEKSG